MKFPKVALAITVILHAIYDPAPGYAVALFTANAQTALLTSSLATSSLSDLGYLPYSVPIATTGFVSDTGFSTTMELQSARFLLSYTGSLSGVLGTPLRVNFTSNGFIGDEDIVGSGYSEWTDYDLITNSYKKVTYSETSQVNPFWIPFLIGVASGIAANYIYDGLTSTDVKPPKSVNVSVNNSSNCNVTVKDPLNTNSCNLTPTGLTLVTQAEPVPVPVPGPLPILSLAAFFRYSRMLRRKIKATPAARIGLVA